MEKVNEVLCKPNYHCIRQFLQLRASGNSNVRKEAGPHNTTGDRPSIVSWIFDTHVQKWRLFATAAVAEFQLKTQNVIEGNKKSW